MVKYLCTHRISVFVLTGVLTALGLLAYLRIPTSLLPDIAIPEIVVEAQDAELTAEEMERQVITPLRNHLSGTGHLRDIRCTARDGFGEVRLKLEYGTRMDLAYVEVNEKVDAAMTQLPRSMKRPNVTRINTADIPVFTLMVTRRTETMDREADHLEMSRMVRNFFKSRLDQLPEVTMVDVSGTSEKELQLVPNPTLMERYGLTVADIETAFRKHNIEAGTLEITEKGRHYGVRLNARIRDKEEAARIPLQIGERSFTLNQVADLRYRPAPEEGQVFYEEKRAIALAVIKQPGVRMEDFQHATERVIRKLRQEHPQYEFQMCNNQADLLRETMQNLMQNLYVGLLLVLLISWVFLHDVRLPVIVAVSMVVALLVSIGGLYLCGISLNIVSLAGLILAVGMMIDNALIATDEINRYHELGNPSTEACAKGIHSVLTPMLSSMLTTVAVFLPLLFAGGLAGVLFHDQAWAITICLAVSYLVAILFLPVLYDAIPHRKGKEAPGHNRLMYLYHRSMNFAFAHSKVCVLLVLLSMPACVVLYKMIDKESLPQTRDEEAVAHITWPHGTELRENLEYSHRLMKADPAATRGSYAHIGRPQFVLSNGKQASQACAQWILRKDSTASIEWKKRTADSLIQRMFPTAYVRWTPPESVMERLFPADGSELTVQIYEKTELSPTRRRALLQQIGDDIGAGIQSPVILPKENVAVVARLDRGMMSRYGVTTEAVCRAFEGMDSRKAVATLYDFTDYIPVYIMRQDTTDLHEWLQYATVNGTNGTCYPLKRFVSMSHTQTAERLESDIKGAFTSLAIPHPTSLEKTKEIIGLLATQHPEVTLSLTGAAIENLYMLKGLGGILLLSLVLIYLILTAQFESFTQPLIVLAEIPIDMAAGLLALWCAGMSLNVMSAIGLIVACGVVVNDSILKLNATNHLRKKGLDTEAAIHEAGRRRLRAIVMTSLTSILALVPVLWSTDMGSEMQKPFAVALIAALTAGTLVSIYIIPLLFTLFFPKR